MLLTQTQVRQRCRNVGFGPRQAKIMSAIAMCEAPAFVDGVAYADTGLVGDQALANDTWGYSYSHFQIRSLRAHTGTGLTRDALRLDSPSFATRSAKAIFDHQGFNAWSTYTNGAYKAYLPDLFPTPRDIHVVQYGDTLDSIALANNTTWEQLARINNIHAPYTIYIGEHILLEN